LKIGSLESDKIIIGQWRTQNILMGGFHSVVWWSFVFGIRYL